MTLNKADLIIHPVRLRILQVLLDAPRTTQSIASQLPDVPKSSIYRHLRLLYESGVIIVDRTRLINGIQEKVYALAQIPHPGTDDLVDATIEDHKRYFATYTVTLLQGFHKYLDSSAKPDLAADRVGYTEVEFWATPEDLDSFVERLNVALMPLLRQEETERRRNHKVAVITYPTAGHRKENE